MRTLLIARIKSRTPDEVIECINQLCPEVSGLCYFNKELGTLMSYDMKYSFYFDPIHGVIEIKEYDENEIKKTIEKIEKKFGTQISKITMDIL
jgi:hypothetical protein